jgi:glutamate/tyrosine decarboxylase-like PLP-dependent enzyme
MGFEVIDPQLAVVCLRDVPAAMAGEPERLDEHQRELQRALEVSGVGWLSTTSLRGRTWLRAGVINYLSTEADANRILEELRAASERVLEDVQPD